MTEVAEPICRQPGCGGPSSGVCIETFSFEECPYLKPAPPEDEAAERGDEEEDTGTEMPPDLVSTGNLAQLDAAGCDAFLRARAATVVSLIAAPDVGKTTLMSTLYELVRRGRLEGYGFAGCETIRGFEERCFLSRARSDNLEPDTQRTPARAGLNFTHLSVATEHGREELILADRSGEHFQRVLDSPGSIAEFAELGRAAVILLMVDGEQLVLNRHRPVSEARRLFMALAQAGLADGRRILLVATKRDLVPKDRMAVLDEALVELLADLQPRSPGAELKGFATGARPREGAEFGEGFDALIAAVLPKPSPRRFESAIPPYSGESPLERLIRPLEGRGA